MKEYEYIMITVTHSPHGGEFQEMRLSFRDGGELVSITARRSPSDDEDIYTMMERRARERGHLVRYDRTADVFYCLDDDTMRQIAGYMRDDIREELHGRFDCNTGARFLARYAERDTSIYDYLMDFDISRDDLAGF